MSRFFHVWKSKQSDKRPLYVRGLICINMFFDHACFLLDIFPGPAACVFVSLAYLFRPPMFSRRRHRLPTHSNSNQRQSPTTEASTKKVREKSAQIFMEGEPSPKDEARRDFRTRQPRTTMKESCVPPCGWLHSTYIVKVSFTPKGKLDQWYDRTHTHHTHAKSWLQKLPHKRLKCKI